MAKRRQPWKDEYSNRQFSSRGGGNDKGHIRNKKKPNEKNKKLKAFLGKVIYRSEPCL